MLCFSQRCPPVLRPDWFMDVVKPYPQANPRAMSPTSASPVAARNVVFSFSFPQGIAKTNQHLPSFPTMGALGMQKTSCTSISLPARTSTRDHLSSILRVSR